MACSGRDTPDLVATRFLQSIESAKVVTRGPVLTIEFERALESGAGRQRLIGLPVGEPQMILDLGSLGRERLGGTQLGDCAPGLSGVEGGAAALVELCRAKIRTR